ncbi:nitrogenase component 1 [Alkalibaculum bacchi]|uniref:nitrogenase component 1 n=1 Tax=Alkalibaculum bacchi TaxID=645887 RepID=UPI0026F08344|nr:nitrogenase component 1 [Alkalibaculum bacchi]
MSEIGLSYFLPEPEKFHTILRVPGSHTLYVGPSSCTRRHAIHAIEYGDTRDYSFLFISEADEISGSYEAMIGEAIIELCEIVEPTPHIFFIAVFCIDDFLGTDEEAMLEALHSRFPGKRFAVNHIDPVTLSKNNNMGMKKHLNLFSFLEKPTEKDHGVNFLGDFVSLEPDCEFLSLLKSWGVSRVRELFHCHTYEEYQDMAKSQMSIVLRFIGEKSAQYLQKKFDMPYYCFTASYDAHYIVEGYRTIASILGHEAPDFSTEISNVFEDAAKTVDVIGDMEIAIDASASLKPFSAAKALLEYGFKVKYIFCSSHMFKIEEEAEEYIREKHKEIRIILTNDYINMILEPDQEIIAIGADCVRLLRARHFADIWHDEGYFGFHGIHRLFALLRDCVTKKYNMPELPIPGKESE